MPRLALAAILALCAGPRPAGAAASDFQVSALPELPAPAAPVAAGVWNRPRSEIPAEAGGTEGLDLSGADTAALRECDAAVRFEKGDAPPQEKADRWRALGRRFPVLAQTVAARAAKWEDYAAQQALDAVLEEESSGAAPAQKRAAWLKLAQSYPRFGQTAQEQAEGWRRYAVELAAVDAVKRRRAKIRDQDWSRLSRLLGQAAVSDQDKQAFAAAFVRAYGKAAADDPYIAKLLPLLPEAMLSPEDARLLAGVEWVTIPGGSFVMGATDLGSSCLPRHRVFLRAFRLARTLVTNRQYQACVRAGACTAPADCGGRFRDGGQPAVCVDWDQAQAFARWAGGRLPTEAEWEYAAGGGQERRYPWGDEEPDCSRAVLDDARWPQAGRPGCGRAATWPVCSKPKGDSRQGLCDMAGEAWQWLQDWYHESYDEAPADGSAWESPAGTERVIRGGAWSYGAASERCSARGSRAPDKRATDVGIRLAQSMLP
jgi:formylglycine-generating enzyme required for sulfatase activity